MKDPQQVLRGIKERDMRIISSVAAVKHKDQVLGYRDKNKECVYLSLGLHPKEAVGISEKKLDKYMQYISDNKDKIVAIGEVGLDHKVVKKKDFGRAREVFLQFVELANGLKLPLVIHSRKSTGDCLKVLGEADVPVVLHCFSGNMTQFGEARERDYYISIATNVGSSKNTKKAAQRTPMDRLLLETDSPWLDPKSGELTNVPWNIQYSAELIAKWRDMKKEEVLKQTEENAFRLFNLKP